MTWGNLGQAGLYPEQSGHHGNLCHLLALSIWKKFSWTYTTYCTHWIPQQRWPITGVPCRRDHNPGLCEQCVGSLTSHSYFANKGWDAGPPAYSPYLRRLKSLTVCWCNYKGSTFSSVILRPRVMVRLKSRWHPERNICNFFELSLGWFVYWQNFIRRKGKRMLNVTLCYWVRCCTGRKI